jgi:hypothetical protein
MLAAEWSHAGVVQVLLDAGADKLARNKVRKLLSILDLHSGAALQPHPLSEYSIGYYLFTCVYRRERPRLI